MEILYESFVHTGNKMLYMERQILVKQYRLYMYAAVLLYL